MDRGFNAVSYHWGPQLMNCRPFLLLHKKDRNYPIRGIPDDIAGVAYSTSTKVWMDKSVMRQWLSDTRVFGSLPNLRRSQIYVDNYSGNFETEAMNIDTENIHTYVMLFPPNEMYLIHPYDSFAIQKIKLSRTA